MSDRKTRIFLDSGNPEDSKNAKDLLGVLDGQTTNPSLVAKHPEAQKYLESGKKLTRDELLGFYRQIIQEIEKYTDGAISVEVYADWGTTAQDMLSQAESMYSWGKNIYMKFPTIPQGLKAANEFTSKGGRVNMTLVFDQNQSAAVYAATQDALQPCFVSPFMGRWDDRGYNGLDLIKNIIRMYSGFDKMRNVEKPHVLVLAASIRNLNHLYGSLSLEADIVTMPLKIIEEWVAEGKKIPDSSFNTSSPDLKKIPYEQIQFNEDFKAFNIEKAEGGLLDEGLKRFANDWNNLLK